MYRFGTRPVTFYVLVVFICASLSQRLYASEPVVSIIIDDIGENYRQAADLIRAETPYTLAILPHTSHSRKIARLAASKGKEIMLHLPMQSVSHHDYPPGTLSLHMTKQQFESQLQKHINDMPGLKGINNHMGSLLTRHPGHMSWLMQTLADDTGLYFVDSRTTDKSIAYQIAQEFDVPSLKRDVFLDPDHGTRTLKQQFARFIKIAKKNRSALAIAHPYPDSIKFLQRNIHRLKQQGIKIVTVSELIKQRRKNRYVACPGSTCSGL